MKYPNFFNNIETIKLKDELSQTLGAFEDGIIEFSYLDCVKLAGHSCPTIAGAYIMTLMALKNLFKNELPKRGEIKLYFKDSLEDGTTGVTSNVISQITGATSKSGFKGLNGKFSRYDLIEFNSKINSNIKFERVDTNQTIEISYNPNIIISDEKIPILMQKILKQENTQEEQKLFGELWQNRVKDIFKNMEKTISIS